MQHFASLNVFAWAINAVFRDVEGSTRSSLGDWNLFIALCLFHIGEFSVFGLLNVNAVRCFPAVEMVQSDQNDPIQPWYGQIRPPFDRFNIEEKMGYWGC